MIIRILVLTAFCLAATFAPAAQAAGNRLSFIRDAEIENTIRAYATPLFEAAGVDPNAINVHLVNDKALNAFVAGGLNMFLNTGLLVRSDHAGQVIGVMAHETGHISGGHLVRMQDALEKATMEALAAMVIGAAAAVAGGRGDAAGAAILGGQEIAGRSFMSYTRGQESSADQAGVGFLDQTRQSSRGLLEFMEILGDQEMLIATRQDPYVRTHPLTRERVSFLRNHIQHSKFSDTPLRPEFAEMHRRMRGKLFAFLEPPARTLLKYKEDDQSIEARYARAVAYYRKPDLDKALPLIDALIKDRPLDPYFHELKGQMLFENGRGAEALPAYREAMRLLPHSPLIRIELAQCQIELEDPSLLEDAQKNLTFAVGLEPDNAPAWRSLGIAHGRAGDDGMASYALAEHALITGRLSEAVYHVERAERLVGQKSSVWLKIQDLRDRIEQARVQQKQQ